jgi:hypothetical protein
MKESKLAISIMTLERPEKKLQSQHLAASSINKSEPESAEWSPYSPYREFFDGNKRRWKPYIKEMWLKHWKELPPQTGGETKSA